MSYGIIEPEAFTSMMALLRITSAEEAEGKFEDTPLQTAFEVEVVSYTEQDEDDRWRIGHKFQDWASFKKGKRSRPTSPTGREVTPRRRLRALGPSISGSHPASSLDYPLTRASVSWLTGTTLFLLRLSFAVSRTDHEGSVGTCAHRHITPLGDVCGY
jgi:hypothetical protein